MRHLLRLFLLCLLIVPAAAAGDHIRELQTTAVRDGKSPHLHWGYEPDNYTQWRTHSNRLIPVYTFGTRGAAEGIDLRGYINEQSPYRSADALRRIYGFVPDETISPTAACLDQTQIFDIQRAALQAGKKHIFLVVFDGMDWNTTRAAAIHNTGQVAYDSGRGSGTHFQQYAAGGTSQFGYMVTAPHNSGTQTEVNRQAVLNPGGTRRGGYNAERGGPAPWSPGSDDRYLVGVAKDGKPAHPYTDSSSSATSMTAGIKTYNGSVNIDAAGARVPTIAHLAQERGYAVGVVTSVPISHATPAAAYAHNVSRNDYQNITRDLLGLPSLSHPERPLSGLDVVIGAGWGVESQADKNQAKNFVPGHRYFARQDLQSADVENGGKYVVALRSAGQDGTELLRQAAQEAAKHERRLLGVFGTRYGHLPFATANGDYQPAPGRSGEAETYTPADLAENPTLAEMTAAALSVLKDRKQGFWLLTESGDVDWANHANNLDASIGAVNSGDAAVKVITDWVEQNSNWDESLLIVTADHGHYLIIENPQALIPPQRQAPAR